jgi:ribonuclease HII
LWRAGYFHVAGIDEAGRGPLAGPVIAAAVIFPKNLKPFDVDDSKKLSPKKREELFDKIIEKALAIGIGSCDEKMIDEINILQATYRAMSHAIAAASISSDYILVDGWEIPNLKIPQTAIIKGDQKCFSIAAASIIAKVTRDRIMTEYDKKFPAYFFAQHKGYPTRQHIEAIEKQGFCEIHRTSFTIKSLKPNGKFRTE